MTSRTPGRTFLDVDLARVVRVELLERVVEALRLEQELQVLLAAVFEEVNHFGVRLYGLDDLGRRQGAAAVLVDQFEAAPRGGEELVREFLDLLRSVLGVELALGGARGQFVFEGVFDTCLPLIYINMPVAVRVHRRERGLEAHRHEQVLQIFIPAVNKERDHFFVRRDRLDDFSFFQRPGLVDVDHFEALASRVQKFDAKFGVGLLRRALAPLAFGGELREALRQAAVDGFLPCAHTDQ